MRTDATPSVVQMEPEVLKNLVKEVKETVAKDIHLPKQTQTSFGIADLWNIRKNVRTAGSRFNG